VKESFGYIRSRNQNSKVKKTKIQPKILKPI